MTDTLKHILQVQHYINKFIKLLLNRAENHDKSKLEEPEVSIFENVTKKLASMEYNSPEYKESLAELGPALAHHYANNRHHPEHFKNGIDDMNLIDILEMFCDWKAAGLRQKDGNLHKSISVNSSRFNMSPQLVRIFENTVQLLEE